MPQGVTSGYPKHRLERFQPGNTCRLPCPETWMAIKSDHLDGTIRWIAFAGSSPTVTEVPHESGNQSPGREAVSGAAGRGNLRVAREAGRPRRQRQAQPGPRGDPARQTVAPPLPQGV